MFAGVSRDERLIQKQLHKAITATVLALEFREHRPPVFLPVRYDAKGPLVSLPEELWPPLVLPAFE